jgi:hypothetical protein
MQGLAWLGFAAGIALLTGSSVIKTRRMPG